MCHESYAGGEWCNHKPIRGNLRTVDLSGILLHQAGTGRSRLLTSPEKLSLITLRAASVILLKNKEHPVLMNIINELYLSCSERAYL